MSSILNANCKNKVKGKFFVENPLNAYIITNKKIFSFPTAS